MRFAYKNTATVASGFYPGKDPGRWRCFGQKGVLIHSIFRRIGV